MSRTLVGMTSLENNISVFGDKLTYKDGKVGKPAFDLLNWIPNPFVDLFQKEAMVDIYFNTQTDGIVTSKTGQPVGLKNRGTNGHPARFIPGKNCTFPSISGRLEKHKYVQIQADETPTDPKHPKTTCFSIQNVPTATHNGQNCIIFISFQNMEKFISPNPRILFTNDSETRSVQIARLTDHVGEIIIKCGQRKTSLQHSYTQWQQLKVQYTCQEGLVECNYTLYNHGSKDHSGTITAPVDPKDTQNDFYIGGFGSIKRPSHLAGVFNLSKIQVYNFYNKELLPKEMTSLILQRLHKRSQQTITS